MRDKLTYSNFYKKYQNKSKTDLIKNKASLFMRRKCFLKISEEEESAFHKGAKILAYIRFSLNDANEVYCHFEEGRLWVKDTLEGLAAKSGCCLNTAKNAVRDFCKLGILISKKFSKTKKNSALSYSIDEIKLQQIISIYRRTLEAQDECYLRRFSYAKFIRLIFSLTSKKNPHMVLKNYNKKEENNDSKHDNKQEGSFDNSFVVPYEGTHELSKEISEETTIASTEARTIASEATPPPSRDKPQRASKTVHIADILTFSLNSAKIKQPIVEVSPLVGKSSPPNTNEEPKMYQNPEQQNIIDRFRQRCKLELGDKTFNSWFKNCAWSYSPSDKTIYLKFDTKFSAEWVESHYLVKFLRLMPDFVKFVEIKRER